MKTRNDVNIYLDGLFWRRYGDWLEANETDETVDKWPLSIPLNPPTDNETVDAPHTVKNWIDSWANLNSKYGVVNFTKIKWRHSGVQEVPKTLEIPDSETVALWVKLTDQWTQAKARYARAVSVFPGIESCFARRRRELFELNEEDFSKLLDVLSWFKENPSSNLYPRELPILGVDTKWLENHKSSVSALSPYVLEAKLEDKTFFEGLGLKTPPFLVRMRILDQSLRDAAGGWSDLQVTLDDLKKTEMRPSLAFIVENIQTGLSFKDIPGAVVFMGLGKGAKLLAEIPWLRDIKLLYWGDIDTFGFQILGSVRKYLPGIKSILMDIDTLKKYKSLCVVEKKQAGFNISHITPEEEQLFKDLKHHAHGRNLRLEQERIDWGYAWDIIEKAAFND
jgi:hypothetical protein